MVPARPHSSGISWLGATAIAFGGCNLSFFLFGTLFNTPGPISIYLLVLGLLISYLAAPGWLKLIRAFPYKVGGITPATAEVMRPYSPILSTIVGIGYWIAWTIAASFSAVFFAMVIAQWIFPNAPINLIAIVLLLITTSLSLLGLQRLAKIVIPIAIITLLITLLSIFLPLSANKIQWTKVVNYQMDQPFPGWFGALSSLMAGLYYVGWIAPIFESSLCFMGEMRDKYRGIKLTLLASIVITTLYCGIIPMIWMGVLGVEPLKKDLITVADLSQMFTSLGEKPAVLFAVAFLLLNTFLSAITPLCNAPRALAQLSKDGFAPVIFGKTLAKNQVPWVATLVTSAIAIFIILFGTQAWLIAATNFDYLVCISVASIAAYVGSRKFATVKTLQPSNDFLTGMGLIAAAAWTLTMIFGFQQFGLPTVVAGIAFAFAGSLFYVWRTMSDRSYHHQPMVAPTLQLKFLSTIFIILILDSIGYLIAVQYIVQLHVITPLIAILEDIFITVSLFTITVGLIVPGMIVTSVESVNKAAKKLAKGTLLDFSNAMTALGKGQLERATANINITPLEVITEDEVGKMTESFNILQTEIARSAVGLKGARDKLIQARKELLEINEQLEQRVKDRTKELTITNETLQETLDDLTLTQDKLIEIRKITMLEGAIVSITNMLSEPIGTTVTAISQLKEEIMNAMGNFNNQKLTNKDARDFFYNSSSLAKIVENNITRAVGMFDKFKKVSGAQLEELQKPITFDLKEYIEFIILSLQTELKNANLTLSFECPPNLYIKSFPGVFFQVLNILISNTITHAFKPGELGNISIKVYEKNENVVITYSDNGSGIPSENIDKIFEPFFTTKRAKGCLGLGLHIARSRVLYTLNGTIECESKMGQGSTFIITFPKKT